MEEMDFVVTWVDGGDPAWQEEKRAYSGKNEREAYNAGRYRDWDFLRYWFRAVENYAPWFRTVHFVTWGHAPDWLNRECPRLRVVRHDGFIPEEYLPTFSSHPIELNLHRIPGLTERFVYFNDDTFLNAPVGPELFFRGGLPCDFIRMNHIVFNKYGDKFNLMIANNEAVINGHFSRSDLLRHLGKVVNFRYPPEDSFRNLLFLRHRHILNMKSAHLPLSFRKSDFEQVWSAVPDILDGTCRRRFRSMDDVTPWLIRSWRLAEGRFFPINRKKLGRAFFLHSLRDLGAVQKALRSPMKMLCINDGYMDDEAFMTCREALTGTFKEKLGRKSMFER